MMTRDMIAQINKLYKNQGNDLVGLGDTEAELHISLDYGPISGPADPRTKELTNERGTIKALIKRIQEVVSEVRSYDELSALDILLRFADCTQKVKASGSVGVFYLKSIFTDPNAGYGYGPGGHYITDAFRDISAAIENIVSAQYASVRTTTEANVHDFSDALIEDYIE